MLPSNHLGVFPPKKLKIVPKCLEEAENRESKKGLVALVMVLIVLLFEKAEVSFLDQPEKKIIVRKTTEKFLEKQ